MIAKSTTLFEVTFFRDHYYHSSNAVVRNHVNNNPMAGRFKSNMLTLSDSRRSTDKQAA